HFNIAETIRQGHDYAEARRDPRESDSLPQVAVQPTSVMPNSYYDPVVSTLFIRSNSVNSDSTILHEYGHFLQAKISTFAPIISNHNGCTATDAVFGHLINSGEHAWMEGFATYFAAAVNLTLPAGTLNMASPTRLESPTCNAVGLSAGPAGSTWTITPAMIEDFVAGILWD